MHRIVVGFDGSRAARAAVDRAIEMAHAGRDWEIMLVCTHDRAADFTHHPFRITRTFMDVDPEVWLDEWDRRVLADMEHESLRVRLAGVDASATCSHDDPAELLVRVAHDVEARYVVVADDRAGALRDLVFGSLARRLLRQRGISVVLVPSTGNVA